MAKQRPVKKVGAAEWMVTYGDLVTLLLCFFVLLFSFRVISEEQKNSDVLGSIRRAFGRTAQPRAMGTDLPKEFPKPLRVLIERLNDSGPQTFNIKGKRITARFVKEGISFTLDGQALFEMNGATLVASTREFGLWVAREYIAGHNNRVIIRGHADATEKRGDRIGIWELAYERGVSMAQLLVDASTDGGAIDGDRIRIVSAGDNLLLSESSQETARRVNRRVEIIVSEEQAYRLSAENAELPR